MKTFRIVLLSILGIVDVYFLYATIGYLVLGIKTPKILGGIQTNFMGMYMMSMTFFALFVVATGIIVFIAIKMRKDYKQKTKSEQIKPEN